MVLSHRALGRYAQIMGEALGFGDEGHERFLSWLPLHHVLGFIQYFLHPLYFGASVTLMSPQYFLREPLRWIEELDATRAQFSAGPCFAYALTARRLEAWEGRRFDLSHWRVADCGGEPIDHRVLERFARAAAPHGFQRSALMPGYGLAEATCGVTMGGFNVDRISRAGLGRGRAEPAAGQEMAVTITSVGEAVPGNEIRIIDDHGAAVPERTLGEITVRSPYLMDGYVGPAAPDAIDSGGWLHTGDRGYLCGGSLYVTGRIKDLIIVSGRNFHAEDIELVVAATPGLRPGGCVAFAVGDAAGTHERLVLLAEADPADEPAAEELRRVVRRKVRSQLGLIPRQVVLLPRGSLPKTTSGKLQRSVARSRYQRGEFKT